MCVSFLLFFCLHGVDLCGVDGIGMNRYIRWFWEREFSFCITTPM